MREHIERLKVFQSLALPDGLGRDIHQHRLLKMAHEDAQMQPSELARFEDERRYAKLVALAIEGTARDLGDTELYIPGNIQDYPAERTMIGDTLNIKHLRAQWDEILHLAVSIKHGTDTASLMLR